MKVNKLLIASASIAATAGFWPITGWAQSELPICDKFDGSAVSYACRCLPDSPLGEVFGTTMYAPSTSLCAGARHAGTIRVEGGNVQIIRGIAQEKFTGSERNGVTSLDSGAATYSIFFMGN